MKQLAVDFGVYLVHMLPDDSRALVNTVSG